MPRGGANNLSEAIRKALGVFGADSDREKSKKIKDWIKQHYPALSEKVDDKTFGSTLSIQRRKVADGGGGTEGEEAEATTAPLASAGVRPAATPSPRGASALAAAPLDVGAMVEAVKDLQELAGRVGGKENLRRLLELLP
jgi:hypothetical protein